MSDSPESLDDIVAELRAMATKYGADAYYKLADRLEAVAARMAEQMASLVFEKSRVENSLNLAQMQVQSLEEKRVKMNRLYTLTVAVRKAQKTYFAERTETHLRASKAAERQLDEFLAQLKKGVTDRQLEFALC